MTSAYHERQLETEICEHLAANGWQYSGNDAGYDKARALFPEDVIGWLAETQPDELAKVVKPGDVNEAKQRGQLLDRLRASLDRPHEHGGGTINVLRKGFAHLHARFQLAQFRPETSLNEFVSQRYGAMRLRVVRQVHYSQANANSIDLVLFVNGIAVATLELKTDFTQSVADAIAQYQQDRDPKGEPLLTSISGALVHFAVSNSDVFMTTKLVGAKTRFLPFNLGTPDGGAGNPVNPAGSETSYLWERILDRDHWLDIVGKFVFVITETTIDPILGAKSTDTKLRFPRLHQWNVVTRLVEMTRTEGAGHRYLIQHSAGSGKTGSISWTAHRLSKLHDANGVPVFDTVIVVTDRTVLDSQLQQAIREIDPAAGYVATVDSEAIRDAGATSKSAVLAGELLKGTRIIVVTIQTFPFAMDEIRKNKGLAHRRFAVIADEAHSSQTGETANQLKAVLSAEELAELEDGGEIDVEAVLAAETAARADSSNISYYAFTATPKAKTLELFGQPGPDGKPVAFDVYTMKQAIEEGYILDVLRGYQTYDLAFRIAQTAADGSDELVDQSAATRGLVRWVALHPTNIDQRVAIVVEHFRANVAHLLDGHAKAMVVCDSRKAAVRYKLAMDRYIKSKGYQLGTLVAFSGSVDDTDSGPDPFTEASMNPDLRGRSLEKAFASDEFQIIVVANKFQTGVDQPLLSAMYVFKKLAGVAAVQTLSRLNRTYATPSGRVKDTTLVLDFVNDATDIQAAFEPYFRDARIETVTDPNLVNDLAAKLDQANLYAQAEIDQAAVAWVKGADRGGGNSALRVAVAPAQLRFRAAYQQALADDDKTEIAKLDLFRTDVATFVRVYDFLSQVLDYGADMEKRANFCRLLERVIRPDSYTVDIDLSDVTLHTVAQVDRGAQDIKLGVEPVGLRGPHRGWHGHTTRPKMVALHEVIERLNDLFADAALTESQIHGFVEVLRDTLLANPTLVQQAKINTKKQFLESPDLTEGVLDAVGDNHDAHNKMADAFYTDTQARNDIIRAVGALLYEWTHADDGNEFNA